MSPQRQAIPSPVGPRMFIEPSVCAPAGSQTIPGSTSIGPECSRSSSRIEPGVCRRSMWCFTYSGGTARP